MSENDGPVSNRDQRFDQERRTALITGCSSGFGLKITVALAERGWNVVATMRDSRRREGLDQAQAAAAISGRIEVVELDVCDIASIESATTECNALTSRLDLVIHNAGIAVNGFFEDISRLDQDRIVATNFVGVMNLSRALLPMLRLRPGSRMVFISSQAVFCPLPGLSIYTATKCGIEGFAESLAVELHPWGVDVHIVEPGAFETSLGSNMSRVQHHDSPYLDLSEQLHARVDELESKLCGNADKAVERMMPTLTGSRGRLRIAVGIDAHITRALKYLLPWRARRSLYCAITGLPKTRKTREHLRNVTQ